MRAVVCLIALGATSLAAFAPAAAVERGKPAWTWNSRVAYEQAYNDNVNQQEGAAAESDNISSLAAEIGGQSLRRSLPCEAYLDFVGRFYKSLGDFNYIELNPNAECHIGRRFDVIAAYWFSPRRLLFDEGPTLGKVFYTENAFDLGLRGKFGERKQLRTELRFLSDWDEYRTGYHQRDSYTPGVAATGRYRFDILEPWLENITTRTGFVFAARNAFRENYDRDVIRLEPGMDLQFPYGIALRLHYEHQWRDYTVGSPRDKNGARNKNYDREDAIDQFLARLIAPVPRLPGFSVALRYRFRHGDYDEPNTRQILPDGTTQDGVREIFDVHEVGVEIALAFGSTG